MYDPASAINGKRSRLRRRTLRTPPSKHSPTLATDAKFDRDELTITVARENIVAACEAVQAAGYNFLEDVTAVDWYPSEPRFQITLSHPLASR